MGEKDQIGEGMMMMRQSLIGMDLFLCISVAVLLNVNHDIDASRLTHAKAGEGAQTNSSEISDIFDITQDGISLRGQGPVLLGRDGETLQTLLAEKSGSILFVIEGGASWARIDRFRRRVSEAAPDRPILYHGIDQGGRDGNDG